MNSRFALETGELVRACAGDAGANAFHHAVSKAFFVDRADIARPEIIVPIARDHGAGEDEVERAWAERRFRGSIDASMRAAFGAGVSGVPAMAWPRRPAVVGMREPDALVAALEAGRR